MNNGWIKLHRKLLESPLILKPTYFALWVVLLLLANHKPKRFIWNNKDTLIKEGQLLTGRKALSKQIRVPESTIEDILKYLETQHQIRQQKTTKYRIITILKWSEYQDTTANPTTEQQQSDTNKNDKNDKNIYIDNIPPKIEEVKKYCIERDNGVNWNKWYDFYESKGWLIGKNKMKSWMAAVRTWEKPKAQTKPLPEIQEISEAQRQENLKKLDAIKSKFNFKTI